MPMFNVSTFHPGHPPSSMRGDSVIRFQIYSSLAYGAQGIYYFTYSGLGSLYNGAPGEVDFSSPTTEAPGKPAPGKRTRQSSSYERG